MLRWIIGSSIRLWVFILPLAAGILFAGFVQLRDAPVNVLPEFDPPYVEIQTEALGLSATEVEQLITVPMEQDLLNGVAWLEEIHSESLPGLSRIQLIFTPGTDVLRARQMVQERLTQAHALPQVSKPPTMIQPLSSTSRVMAIRLSSDELSAIDLSVLAHWTIKPQLMGVPGVANVAIWGERDRQIQVQVDPEQLNAQGVTLMQVVETAGNALWVSPLTFLEASTPGTGGFIDSPNQRIGVQHVLPITTPDELAQVPVEGTSGDRILHLGDVATLTEEHQPLIGDVAGGESPDLLLVIEEFPEASTLEVTRAVEDKLAEMQPGLGGIQIDTTVFRPANYIESALDSLSKAILIGFVLVVLTVGVLSFDWRSALVCAVALPVSLVAAGVVLQWRGESMNALTLAGFIVALGIVIDDVVTDVDNIMRRVRENSAAPDGRSTARVVLDASQEVRSPIAAATFVILLTVMPIAVMEYLTGSFYQPLALSFALALVASLVVALTLTPALALALLSVGPRPRRESPVLGWIKRRYSGLSMRIMHRPIWSYATVVVIVGLGLLALPQIGLSSEPATLPSFKERDLLIDWEAPPGTSLPEMNRITTAAMEELQSINGVRSVVGQVGRAVTSDIAEDVNKGQIWVSIDPNADYDKTRTAVESVVAGYPGIDNDVRTYSDEKLDEAKEREGSADSIVVRIRGEDLATLRAKADEVQKILGNTVGVTEAFIDSRVFEPQIEIDVDLDSAERYGIKPGDVRRAAATLVQGLEVGSLYEEQKVFQVVVLGVPEIRGDVTDIRNLLIDTPGGGQVRLADVAEVRIASNPSVIRHQGVARYIDVEANVAGRDLGGVATDVEERLAAVAFPLGYHAEVLGEYAERQAAQQRLLSYAVAAAVGVYLLLQVSFRSWRLATLAFLTLPIALVGGVLAVWLGDGVVSLGALVGFLTVLGIVARNGIMLISHYQHLEQAEGVPFGRELVLRGTQERLAPILTTAVATGLALLPLVVAGSIPGHEIEHPMAVVILGGLLTSTLLNLFVVPTLYLRFGKNALPATSDIWASPALAPSVGTN
jgi:CzcA family heavy metal efflux pump